MEASGLASILSYSIRTHHRHARTDKKRTRKWDRKTPFGVHPSWCALTILTETKLPEEIRETGAQVLALHDMIEDTTGEFPFDTPQRVRDLVYHMSFMDGLEQEMAEVWQKDPEVRLLKLYDKVSNLLDGQPWMDKQKWLDYCTYALRLATDVNTHFGELNIVRIARAICVN